MPDSTHVPSRRRWFLILLVAALFGAGIWYLGFHSPAKPPGRGPNPSWAGNQGAPLVPVRVVPAKAEPLPVYLKAIGTVTPFNTVTVRSRVEGQLLNVKFEEGQKVKKGDVLAEIDPEPYRILLAEAEGQFEQNSAQVQVARNDLARLQPLTEKNLVSAQQVEVQQALVREREGALSADRARVADARLKLAYTRIEAPISGRIGLRQVDAGNLIRAGESGGLAVITETQPISVLFTVPEMDVQKVLDPLRAGERLEVEAWDRSEKIRLATGFLKTVDNQIEIATGTLRLKAEFPNEDEKLFPNQFVNVRLRVRTLDQAIVIPAAAVQFGSQGNYVYVIGSDNVASVRKIVLGPVEGATQAVTSGLVAGENVVLEGLDRLREGRRVITVDDQAAPTAPSRAP